MPKTWLSAYQSVQTLQGAGYKITQKTISLWKKNKKIKVDEKGLVCIEELQKMLKNKKERAQKIKKKYS